MNRVLLTALYITVSACAGAQVLAVREAESTTITMQNQRPPHREAWASGGFHTPVAWGATAGDRLDWEIDLPESRPGLKLGIRYAYHKTQHDTTRDRTVYLEINGLGSYPVELPDTKGWNHFEVAEVTLPELMPGRNRLSLVSPGVVPANIDSFVIFREPVDRLHEAALRPSRLPLSDSGRFYLLTSPDLQLVDNPGEVYRQLDLLYDQMKEDFGREVPLPIFFHLTSKARWRWGSEKVVGIKWGLYALSDGKPVEREILCFILAQCFGHGRLPAWFSQSMARTLGYLKWIPSLGDVNSQGEDARTADLINKATAFLADPEAKTNEAEVVQAAMYLKFGDSVFSRLAQKVNEAVEGQTGDPGDKYQLLGMLSEVAGEDVVPYYRRWTGFTNEGPVDPLVITLPE